MSDIDNEQPEMKEMLNKMSRYNKNTKALMELIGKVSEKLDKVLDWNGGVKNDNDEKERVGKILEKKGVGRPVGNWDSKREQYLKMLNEDKIKQPKASTLEFYKIVMVGDGSKDPSGQSRDKYVFVD